MPTRVSLRSARVFIVLILALGGLVPVAHSQAAPGGASSPVTVDAGVAAPPALEQASGASAPKEAVPDVLPGLNKKRVAFWGVAFMLSTSLVFAIFGAWAIRKTPKPGQQRPDSYEKKQAS